MLKRLPWLLSIALALGIALHFWSVAFPVAAVPFPLARTQVQARMAAFLTGLGAPLDQYRTAIRFGESTDAKNFIERRYGPARLTAAARDGIALWFWTGRWFRPGQHEEFQASTDQAGRIVGYNHVIEDERPLPTLPQPQARALAEAFLRQNITQHPFAALHYLEASSEQKPARTDYTFTWEVPALRMDDAPYHLEVTIQGSQIGAYTEFLKIPESWTIQYARQRSVNDLCYTIALFATRALFIALLAVFLIAIARHRIRWRDGVPWGWLLVIGAVAAASQLNGIPSIVFDYPTTQQWSPFVAGAIFSGFRSVLTQVSIFWLLMLVADSIYRDNLPGKSSFRRALGPQALHDPETVRALGIGIAFATFSVAYVCLFYTAAQHLGVWCPIEIDYSRTLTGSMPWVEAVQTGLTAAFSEEMLFRVGALLLLVKLLRVRWLAVLLSAAAWAFMHSNYPQMPGYTRGIELTIVGIVWGFLLLRYGVIATLATHYLYDCWMGSLIAFHSAGWGNKAGAIIASAWPLGLYLWAISRRHPELAPETPPIETTPPLSRLPSREWTHAPLRLTRLGILLLLAFSAAVLTAIPFVPLPQRKMQALGKLDLSRQAILDKADAALRQLGYSPAGYQRIASNYAQGLPFLYLLEHGDLDQVAGLYGDSYPDLCWSVRYFRFLHPESFSIDLDSHGRLLTWSHTILREAPGAQLPEPAALALAGAALTRGAHLDLARQTLVRVLPVQQENRRDWIFAFDQKDFRWGDARFRTYIRLLGSEAVDLTRFVKVPDAWILERQKSGWRQLLSGEFQHWASIAEAAIIGVLLIIAIRKHLTPWREAFQYALFPLTLNVIDQLNQARQFYAGYATTTPRVDYLISQFGARAEGLLTIYLQAVFVIAVALGFLHWAWGWTPAQLTIRQQPRSYWSDTSLIALFSISSFQLLGLLNDEILGHFWPAEVASIRYWSVVEWAPWIGAVTEALQDAYGQLIHLAIIASVLRLVWSRHPRLAWSLLFLIPLLNLGAQETIGGFLWGLAYSEALLFLTAILMLRLWRFNLPAIFLTYFLPSLASSMSLFLRNGGPCYQWQALPLILLIVCLLAGIVWTAIGQTESENISAA